MKEILFKEVSYTLGGLVERIHFGEIGLPDIQRPFIWKNIKVRDLFDSMYRGYPVGYLLFWENGLVGEHRVIGVDGKQKAPSLLIVDGQQRLTSLYAVLRGVPVVRDNYAKEQIEIAFNPLDKRFEVADAAIKKDKAYIPNISTLWSEEGGIFEIVDAYLTDLATTREITADEQKQIKSNISRLENLTRFPFTALELSADIDEEQVAEVFVRINSQGITLNQADFILTIMSVFWDEGRTELEQFSRGSHVPAVGKASSFNHFIEPKPDQLLRASVGLGFKRARLQHVYSILRGKDLETGAFSAERRVQQFEVLKDAQSRAIKLTNWHDFFKAINLAGYRGGRMISSDTNLIYAYTLYLIGRTEFGVEEAKLRQTIARWFFMSSLTGRYSSSPESTMEFDLARLREAKTSDEFVHTLERVCDTTLTSDFWSITLPNELATSSPKSPSLFAYHASLALLTARALFSKHFIWDLLDPSIHSTKAGTERHHLFPKAYLKTLGITETRDTNQIANYALLEWTDHALISDRAPGDYLSDFAPRLDVAERKLMYYWHALPEDWEKLEYQAFLAARRELIARVIRDAYLTLANQMSTEEEEEEAPLVVADLVAQGETPGLEFKSTLRMNLHTRQPDPRMELGCLKTIAGFLNTAGGTLVVGVSDDGTPVGIHEDGFQSEDKLYQHLANMLKDRLGLEHVPNMHVHFADFDSARVLVVECRPSKVPVYVKDGGVERFFIRSGTTTAELGVGQVHDFIKQRFGV